MYTYNVWHLQCEATQRKKALISISFSSSGIRTLMKGFRAMPGDFPNMMQRHCQNYSKKCFPTSKIPTTSIHVLCQNMDVRPHQRSDRTHSST